MEKYGSVQYLRAVAALAVVLFHGVTIMNPASAFTALRAGHYGVDLFFVISGFIMMVTSRPSMSPRDFLVKRIKRVVPLYWIATGLTIAAALAVPSAFRSTEPDVLRTVLSLFFVPHYHAVFTQDIRPILAPGWTLNYEMYFYLLFAATLALTWTHRARVVIAAMLLLCLLGYALQPSGAILRTCTDPFLFEFGFGVLIGHLHLKREPRLLWRAACAFGALGGAAMAWSALSAGGVEPQRWVGAGTLSASLLAAGVALEASGCRFEDRTMLLLAEASYAIYLFHFFGLGAVRWIASQLGATWSAMPVDAATLILGTLVATLFGIAVHLGIERPLQAVLTRSAGRAAPPEPKIAGTPSSRSD